MPYEYKKKESKRCLICEDSGWIIDEKEGYEVARRCECYQTKRKKRLLIEARIPFRYKHCTFENFDLKDRGNMLTIPNPEKNRISIAAARDFAEGFVRKYPKVKKGLFFMGRCGVGKTHLSVAIIKELINKKGIPCIFYDFRDLLSDIKSTYVTDSPVSSYEVLKPVLEQEILVLDELGAQKVTEWMRDTLTYIINRRYNDNRHIIITSNWLDDSDDEEETLIGRIGYRLRSRLYEMCDIMEIVGEDYRRRD